MSRIDSNKELSRVYRLCLSALNRDFKHEAPSPEKGRKLEVRVAKEAAKKEFASSQERENWIKLRFKQLYHEVWSRQYEDRFAGLKAQIKQKMGDPVR